MVQNCQMASQFLKWLALLTDHQRNSQNHAEICYKIAVFQCYVIAVSIVANSDGKCIM